MGRVSDRWKCRKSRLTCNCFSTALATSSEEHSTKPKPIDKGLPSGPFLTATFTLRMLPPALEMVFSKCLRRPASPANTQNITPLAQPTKQPSESCMYPLTQCPYQCSKAFVCGSCTDLSRGRYQAVDVGCPRPVDNAVNLQSRAVSWQSRLLQLNRSICCAAPQSHHQCYYTC